jgi:uncharacterized membrane protein
MTYPMEELIHPLSFSLDSLEALNATLILIKRILALLGALVILIGAIYATFRFLMRLFMSQQQHQVLNVDRVRLDLGRSIALGLEFIIASDIIETTTTPDYYSLGILGFLVVIRTFLNYFLNKDLNSLSKRESQENA